MDQVDLPSEETIQAGLFLKHLQSEDDLQKWVELFFRIKMPKGHIYPESNSSPIEWMWSAYKTYRDNKGNDTPGFIILSARECYKTLSESMLAVILMLHFGATIAHLAAIESQAVKALQYINSFINKCKKYIEMNGLQLDSQSKRRVGFVNSAGDIAYVNVIIATIQGANSEHTNVLSIDEIDVMRFPEAYEEAKFIPGMMNGQYPITIKTSTRKFAFGMMQKELDNAQTSGDIILRWNIIDVTEHCNASRHKPNEPMVERYIHPRLPLRNRSQQDIDLMTEEEKSQYQKLRAYSGCSTCPLLPVCQTKLAARPETDVGGLYKPIDFVIGQFRRNSPEKSEAQLLCLKPSSTGLVYPRFNPEVSKDGNVYTLTQAMAFMQTMQIGATSVTLDDVIKKLQFLGVKFYAGVDWGFRHAFAITVSCIYNKEWWIVDSYSVSGLEFDQMIRLAESVRDIYKPKKWFADTSMPMFIKEFKKRRMICAEFKKDVMGGIECTRGQIVDALGNRYLRILKHERTEFLIKGFQLHHFILGTDGKPTQEPDDEEYADIMDTIRYKAQNLFAPKAKSGNFASSDRTHEIHDPSAFNKAVQGQYDSWLTQEIQKNVSEASSGEVGQGVQVGKSGNIFWDF